MFTVAPGLLLGNTSGSGGDPYFSSVVLSLHGNGANNATTTVDSSLSARTITTAGAAKLSTAQSKFGPSSMLFGTNGDAFTAPSNSAWDFGSGDFTIEGWVYPPTVFSGSPGILVRDIFGGTRGFALFLGDGTGGTTAGAPVFFCTDATNSTLAVMTPSSVLAAATWSHVAITRRSGTFNTWKNGVSVATTSSGSGVAIQTVTAPICVGARYGPTGIISNTSLGGCLDDIRVTKGVARYTATFTPPILANPDF